MEDSNHSGSAQPKTAPNASQPSGSFGFALFWIGFATLVAFRSVLGAPFEWTELREIETWFFDPSRDSRAVSIFVAIWLLWRRRKRFAAWGAPDVSPKHLVAAIGIVLLFSWATAWRAPLLLMFCLYAFGATILSAWGGASAVAILSMPCLALVVSVPPPNPILSEIVWWLQGVSARGAHGLLSLSGLSIGIAGTELQLGDQTFTVIEACSGWRGISILLVVSIVAAELHRLSIRRTLLLALVAIPLGIGLNIARVAAVIATRQELDAQLFESHTPQGIAVLLAGSLVLYAVAAALGSLSTLESPSEARRPAEPPGWTPLDPGAHRRFRRFALTLSLVLAAISLLLPPRSIPTSTADGSSSTQRPTADFPLKTGGWVGTSLDPDYYFPYNSGDHPQFHTEYQRDTPRTGLEIVDLFIAFESPEISGLNRLPESKLILPAGNWQVDSRTHRRIPLLGVDAQSAIVSRGDPKLLTYVLAWRIHDRGLMMESLASLLGLDACQLRPRRCTRGVVRLAVPILNDTERDRNRARKTATGFMRNFQGSLAKLSE